VSCVSNFGGAGAEALEEVDWDRWFEVFEDRELALLHQQQKASGEESTFVKLVKR